MSWGGHGSSSSVLSWLSGLNHSLLALWAVSAVLAWALLSALGHLLRDSAGVLDVLLEQISDLRLGLLGSSWSLLGGSSGESQDLSERSGNGSR